jgi:hypothetical protein
MSENDIRTYEVQSERDKSEWYEVTLELCEERIGKASCTCSRYFWQNEPCAHIERALSCYRSSIVPAPFAGQGLAI